MLTKQELIQFYDWDRQIVRPDRLTRKTHSHYVELARQMLSIYNKGIGKSRRELHQQIATHLREIDDCPSRRIAACCKLLDDASQYNQDRDAAKLRMRVFTLAAEKHPLVDQADQLFENDQQSAKQSIANEIGLPWEEIQRRLFSDVIEFHTLAKPPIGVDAIGLLSRYNLAQTQGTLYNAVSMKVWASADFKLILRYAKLARLMHTIERHDHKYLFQFNGPASILRQTKRYGVQFARFLPGLISTNDWTLQANIVGPKNRPFRLRLSSQDGLRGEIDHTEFDSLVEQQFAARWQSSDTDSWKLSREATVLHQGQTVFTPDFTLTRLGHKPVQLEIVGFWTPEYLREKATRLAQFSDSATIILAIAESLQQDFDDLGIPTVTYKTRLQPKAVLELLRQHAEETTTATKKPS